MRIIILQGPCEKGEWIVFNENWESECQMNPCPLPVSQDKYIYYFKHKSTCHNTDNFCEDGQRVAFCVNGQKTTEPRCVTRLFTVFTRRRPNCPNGEVEVGNECVKKDGSSERLLA